MIPSYFVVTNLAETETEVIHFASLLRGTESAWQAVSYGLTSLDLFGKYAGVYLNFGLYVIALAPAWLVIRNFGVGVEILPNDEDQRDGQQGTSSEDEVESEQVRNTEKI